MKSFRKKMLYSILLQVIFSFVTMTTFFSCAQNRASPPRTAEGTIDGIGIAVDYSSPGVKGREVWGELVPYGQVWRTGANEATVITFDKPVEIEGKALPAGEYSMFTIPNQEKWTIIFNDEADQWGAFDYEPSKDALRVEVTPEETNEFMERLVFEVDDAQGEIAVFWEKLKVAFSVKAS